MSMTVVIVDDTQTNLSLTTAMVSRLADCTAVSFLDPRKALDYCTRNAPDLVIVDYLMPDLDGLEFIRLLRECHSIDGLPILMVTGDTEREVRYRALELGATDFLTKPIDRVEFQARIRNSFGLRRGHLAQLERSRSLAAEVLKATEELRFRERETIHRLARAAEYRDPETGSHILRMSHYASVIARGMGWSEAKLELLLHAAPMHDIGKLGTPDHILLKPGKLTPEEFEIMKQHATIGWSILKDSNSPMLQLAATIAHTHHEKFDGSGYPHGLQGTEIPECGRIVAVADVFDALTSDRPYKPAWPIEKAIALLKDGRGKHFDPQCVDIFFERWDEIISIRDQYSDEF